MADLATGFGSGDTGVELMELYAAEVRGLAQVAFVSASCGPDYDVVAV